MAFDYQKLTAITTIPSSVGSIYTNPSSTKSYIRQIIIHNGNTTVETVILYNVPVAGSVGDLTKFYEEDIPVNGTTILDFGTPGIILDAEDDAIQADTDTASKVTIQIMGGTE